MADMRLSVRLFASLRDLAGTDSLEVEVPEGTRVCDLASEMGRRFPALKEILETRKVFISVNQDMAGKEDVLNDGDEVGFLPPFSGG